MTYRKIIKGEYKFDSPWWDDVSDNAKVQRQLKSTAKYFGTKNAESQTNHSGNGLGRSHDEYTALPYPNTHKHKP